MHFDGLRLVALREGGMNEETIETENERKSYTRTCAHTLSPRGFLLLEHTMQPALPAFSADWPHGPCLASCSIYPVLGACSMYPGKLFCLSFPLAFGLW